MGTSNNCLRPLAYRRLRHQGATLPAGWLSFQKVATLRAEPPVGPGGRGLPRAVAALACLERTTSLPLRKPPCDSPWQVAQRPQAIIRGAHIHHFSFLIRSWALMTSVRRIPYFSFTTTTSPCAMSVPLTITSSGSPARRSSSTTEP